jgi:predicted HicB family RNase H-like nuclease
MSPNTTEVSEQLNIKVTRKLKERLLAAANKQNRSLSNYVYLILEAHE